MNPASNEHARAALLIEQRRYDLAEGELGRLLARDPDNADAHMLMAFVQMNKENWTAATEHAERAIALDPTEPRAHYTRSLVCDRREMLDEALESAREAVRLDPQDADYWTLVAGILAQKNRHREALEAADRALAIDAENDGAANMRAVALRGLGRNEESERAVRGTLARDPNNYISHFNQGWTALHQGDARRAQEHFREALRLRPDFDPAREGLIEATKARSFLYRVVLTYILFMSRLPPRTQWVLIIVAWLSIQALRSLSRSMPAIQPFVTPIVVLYLVVVVTSVIGQTLADLVLLTTRFGRLALTRAAKIEALALFGMIAGAVGALATWASHRQADEPLVVAMVLAFAVLPIGVSRGIRKTGRTRLASAVLIAGVASALVLSAAIVTNQPWATAHLKAHVWGCVLSVIFANIVVSRPKPIRA